MLQIGDDDPVSCLDFLLSRLPAAQVKKPPRLAPLLNKRNIHPPPEPSWRMTKEMPEKNSKLIIRIQTSKSFAFSQR